MNIIDVIVLVTLALYFSIGFLKGFFRTLLGPIALIIGTILAIVYYHRSGDLLAAVALSIVAPFLINILFAIVLKLFNKARKKDKSPKLASRLFGGFLSVSWAGFWLILVLVFIVIAPIQWGWVKNLQSHIASSKTYYCINELIKDKLPEASINAQQLPEILSDPKKFNALKDTDEYDELVSDKKIRDLLTDEETMEQIQNQNIPQLLSNPKFQEILKDEELIKKVFKLHKKLMEMESAGEI